MTNLGDACVECGLSRYDTVHAGERKPKLNPAEVVVGGERAIVREYIEPHEFTALLDTVRDLRDQHRHYDPATERRHQREG